MKIISFRKAIKEKLSSASEIIKYYNIFSAEQFVGDQQSLIRGIIRGAEVAPVLTYIMTRICISHKQKTGKLTH